MGFLNTLQIIAAFNFFLVGGLILLNKRVVTYGVKLLAIFLVAKGVTLFTNLTYSMDWPIPQNVVIVLSSALFLYAPFLYLFARYVVKKKVINWKQDWIHFILFGLYLIVNVVYVLFPFETAILDYSVTIFYYLQTVIYTVSAFMLMHKKGDGSKNQYWLKHLLLSFLVIWLMFLTEIILSIWGYYSAASIFKTLGVLFILVLANLTLVIALYSPELFFKGLRVLKKSTSENTIITEENYNSILSLMANKELYTNPQLKLVDISNAMGISERNTSLLIKTYHQGNFYDFLNSFRIEEAKRLFIEKQDELSISEVLYEVGFNSKSVFNTIFKKKEGMTPSQFKKNHAKLSSAG